MVTTVGQKFVHRPIFPAVTVCSLNLVHCRNLYDRIEAVEAAAAEDARSSAKRLRTLCNIYVLGRCQDAIGIAELATLGVKDNLTVCIDRYARVN